jgi:hypothetical protein
MPANREPFYCNALRIKVATGAIMATDEQRQLASLALVLIAAVGVVLAALSGRSVQGMSPLGASLSGLGRNRGSVGSYGSIGWCSSNNLRLFCSLPWAASISARSA